MAVGVVDLLAPAAVTAEGRHNKVSEKRRAVAPFHVAIDAVAPEATAPLELRDRERKKLVAVGR
jgi:hypothetical protein